MITTTLTALGEPTRLAALRLLADGAEHCVCEMMPRLGATQSRLSRHMKTLKEAGLIVDRRDAQWVRYRLSPNMPALQRNIVDAVLTAAEAEAQERAQEKELVA